MRCPTCKLIFCTINIITIGEAMPINIKVLHDGMGVLYDCYGALTGKDFIDANDQIMTFSDEIKHLRYGFIDTMEIADISVSESEMMVIASQDEKIASFIQHSVIVAVVAKSVFAFGLSRIWSSLIEHTGWETMSFRDRLTAESWVKERVKANFGIDVMFS
jgi:hypothetical protein